MADAEASQRKRNRIIAIAAGSITAVAIVLAFASSFLGLRWEWLHPAAELLLLAELVGLIVLERHQLFEPVHEKVNAMHSRMEEMHAMISENARSSGQVTTCASSPEIYRTFSRVLREALGRDQSAPKILRIARLAGRILAPDDPGVGYFQGEGLDAIVAYFVTASSSPHARTRRWSVRWLVAFADAPNFEENLEQLLRPRLVGKPSNFEFKVLVRPTIEATLSPTAITDRDAVLVFDDATASFQWGFCYQGPQYVALFERWFDDLWSNIPDSYLVYSRGGFNEGAVERIRKELAAAEAANLQRIG